MNLHSVYAQVAGVHGILGHSAQEHAGVETSSEPGHVEEISVMENPGNLEDAMIK